ncbi:MAG: HD domain-containing protein [Spirochaetota bacterium]|nr:HD domain-containing protein [Spirochaetota bacterium]
MKLNKIDINDLRSGMFCTKAIVNKKKEVLLPEFHSIHPLYITEWRDKRLFTEGEVLTNKQDQKKSFELPSYIEKETRILLQKYYDDIKTIKEIYKNIKKIDINEVQKLASFWVSYALKNKNMSSLLAVCRHALFEEDEYFYIHTMDVVLISLGIYKYYYKKIKSLELSHLIMSAIFFDIGMLLLPKELKGSVDKFHEEQKLEIKKHTLLGYGFLIKSEVPYVLALPSLEHHERPDGSGYPRGISGENLQANSIIISLADVFTSQMRARSFKEGREPAEILKDFIQTMMPVFPNNYNLYISAFISFMTIYPTTSIVKLSTGDIATVLQTNIENPTRPKVLLLLDKNMNKYSSKIELDLTKDSNTIVGTYTRAMLVDLKISLKIF